MSRPCNGFTKQTKKKLYIFKPRYTYLYGYINLAMPLEQDL